ncbi:MAG TPA: hypothetical protein VM736_03715 [Gemmatimonadales bacterium]|nr:hypothetical protein [Gemmatimonadales bacterium]
MARRAKRRARLSIRINPDVATETHAYTKTGERTAKPAREPERGQAAVHLLAGFCTAG